MARGQQKLQSQQKAQEKQKKEKKAQVNLYQNWMFSCIKFVDSFRVDRPIFRGFKHNSHKFH